jgi:hypothetical protein
VKMRMMPPSTGPRQNAGQSKVAERRNSYEAPIGNLKDRYCGFDSVVRDEMNRLEQKIKSMAIDRGPTSSFSNNSHRDHQRYLLPSAVQVGSVKDLWKSHQRSSQILDRASVEHLRGHQGNERSFGTHDGSAHGDCKFCLHSKSSADPSSILKSSYSLDQLPNQSKYHSLSPIPIQQLTGKNDRARIMMSQTPNQHLAGKNDRSRVMMSQNPIQRLSGKNDLPLVLKSPTQARLRLVSDMYGASSVINDSKIPLLHWKPSSLGQGDDKDRKRLAALEHKNALDEQVAQDRKRKDLEKEKDRLSDDKAMQRMVKQHEDERERARVTRDALRIAMQKDASRVPHQGMYATTISE